MKAKLTGLIMMLWAFNAMTTTMYLADLQELSTESEVIIQAKVTSVVTQLSKDGQMITTYIRCNISHDLIGDNEDNEIILAQPGGRAGNTFLEVEGTTAYKIGEDNVLFLRKDPHNSGVWQTLGMYQGRYKIFYDNDGTPYVSQVAVGEPELLKRANTTENTGNNMPLEQFKELVTRYLTTK